MDSRVAFEFMNPEIAAQLHKDAHLAYIPASISDERSLYDVLEKALNLPGYFGKNWDALDECLEDFWWISVKKIVMIHEDVPDLGPKDLAIYLRILHNAVTFWAERKEGEHKLRVFFPEDSRLDIIRALSFD